MENLDKEHKEARREMRRMLLSLDDEELTKTSMFGTEYTPNGTFTAAHRPAITNLPGREFFASVTMKNGLIHKVE